jgi:hypothetical protein
MCTQGDLELMIGCTVNQKCWDQALLTGPFCLPSALLHTDLAMLRDAVCFLLLCWLASAATPA